MGKTDQKGQKEDMYKAKRTDAPAQFQLSSINPLAKGPRVD